MANCAERLRERERRRTRKRKRERVVTLLDALANEKSENALSGVGVRSEAVGSRRNTGEDRLVA